MVDWIQWYAFGVEWGLQGDRVGPEQLLLLGVEPASWYIGRRHGMRIAEGIGRLVRAWR